MLALLVWIAVVVAIYGLMRIDWTPGVYRVGIYSGADLDLRSRLTPGWLRVNQDEISIEGPEPMRIPLRDIESLTVGPFQGARRVFRLQLRERAIAIIVVRFTIARWFFLGDAFKAVKLEAALEAVRPPNPA